MARRCNNSINLNTWAAILAAAGVGAGPKSAWGKRFGWEGRISRGALRPGVRLNRSASFGVATRGSALNRKEEKRFVGGDQGNRRETLLSF